MGARVRVRGEKQVAARLRRLANKAEDVSPVWPRVGAYVARTVNQQFVTEGARLGKPWKPLKPEYRLWKMRNGYSRKILVQTGEMRRKFTGRPMDVEEYGPNWARFGTTDQKAIWQHYGTERNGKRVITPRKILWAHKDIRDTTTRLMNEHLMGRKR